jgi:hypothetical protein
LAQSNKSRTPAKATEQQTGKLLDEKASKNIWLPSWGALPQPVTMAAMNKSLARSNKSRTAAKATEQQTEETTR